MRTLHAAGYGNPRRKELRRGVEEEDAPHTQKKKKKKKITK
jgi:hypothetical protein